MRTVISTTFLFFFLSFTGKIYSQDQLPQATIKSIDGQNVSFEEIVNSEKVTIISFWATWCAPCKKELDAIADLYEDWQDQYNVELIAVSVDDARAAAKVKPMIAEKGWPYRVFIDTNQSLMRSLHFQTVPYTILVDKNQKIVYTHSGYLPGDELELEEKVAKLDQ
ncbi:MAG: TlpA family protein disulfide reductase [Saprospiraceae bacterium]|nr:TlpA family protein disulfide reductase [Saprospiraceae bacterium]